MLPSIFIVTLRWIKNKVMKTYISYVVQNENGHKHLSEVLETKSPPYSYSADPQVQDVMQWADKKRKELKKEESLVITSMFKL